MERIEYSRELDNIVRIFEKQNEIVDWINVREKVITEDLLKELKPTVLTGKIKPSEEGTLGVCPYCEKTMSSLRYSNHDCEGGSSEEGKGLEKKLADNIEGYVLHKKGAKVEDLIKCLWKEHAKIAKEHYLGVFEKCLKDNSLGCSNYPLNYIRKALEEA
jgi:hypothetical protein